MALSSSTHLDHISAEQFKLLNIKEIDQWVALITGHVGQRASMPFNSLSKHAQRIQQLLNHDLCQQQVLDAVQHKLVRYIDYTHWVLQIPLRFHEHEHKYQAQQISDRNELRDVHLRNCQALVADSPLGRLAWAQVTFLNAGLSTAIMNPEQLASSATSVSASGKISRLVLQSEYQPENFHDNAGGDPCQLLLGPLCYLRSDSAPGTLASSG